MTETKNEDWNPKRNIPETVSCLLGADTPYDVFAEHYSQVYQQVRDMDHLLVGRVTYSGKIGFKISSTIQTHKQAEMALLSETMPSAGDIKMSEVMLFEILKLAMSLSSFNGVSFNTVKVSRKTELSEWEKKSSDKIGLIEEFDQVVINHLLTVIDDVSNAKRFAFMEVAENPSKPHEHSSQP